MKACSEKINDGVDEETGEPKYAFGRLVWVMFYLKNDRTDELIEMDRVGPNIPEDDLKCTRKKLEFGHYFVD